MTLDRWRGERGFMGWVTFKWDVYQLRRFAKRSTSFARQVAKAKRRLTHEG